MGLHHISSHTSHFLISLEMGLLAIVIFTFVFSFAGSEASPLPGPDPVPVPAWKLIETEDGEEPSKPDVGFGWINRYGYGHGIVPAGAGGKKEEKKVSRR